MANTLTVMLSGVIGFVRNTDGSGYRAVFLDTVAPGLPHTWQRKALDGRVLRAHYPHVRRDRSMWFPERGRVLSFDLGGAAPPWDDQLDKVLRMEWAMDKGEIELDPGVLARAPGAGTHNTLDITCGILRPGTDTYGWHMDGTVLKAPSDDYTVAHHVEWEIGGLNQDVTVTDGAHAMTLPTGAGDVTIGLQNFLPEDLVTQLVGNPGTADAEAMDFRWYYEALSKKARGWVQDQLGGGGHLPTPTRPSPHTQGLTQNCMPAVLADASY